MKIKRTEIESMLYRMGRLDRICEDLRDVISGEGKYYTDDIRTEKGRYSSRIPRSKGYLRLRQHLYYRLYQD